MILQGGPNIYGFAIGILSLDSNFAKIPGQIMCRYGSPEWMAKRNFAKSSWYHATLKKKVHRIPYSRFG